jgi:pyrroloquinoline quinone biosynthesis protein B
VRVVLLGTAAGGGFPQWNCWCPSCRVARYTPNNAIPRRQSSAAISVDGERWFLLNASPDVRDQIALLPSTGRLPPLRADTAYETGLTAKTTSASPATIRHVPIEGVLLTDAELDHTLGLVLLREARRLPLWMTASVSAMLEDDSRILPVTRAFADVPVTELRLETPQPLCYRDGSPSGMSVEAFAVAAGPPRFARRHDPGHTIGMVIRDEARGTMCAFVPGCGELTPSLLERFAEADVLLFDGTFWKDDELIALGIGNRTATEMDHLPISGPAGSLAQLAALPCRHRIYTHINNTNPMLVEHAPERAIVEQAGLAIGVDGMDIEV